MGDLTLPPAPLVQRAQREGWDHTPRGRSTIPWKGWAHSEQPHTAGPDLVPEQPWAALAWGGGEHLFIGCTIILCQPLFQVLGTKSLPSWNRNSRERRHIITNQKVVS